MVLSVAGLRNSWREAVRQAISNSCLVSRKQAVASTIAGIVSDTDVHDALKEAKQKFKCITINDLTEEDLANPSPDPMLFARSRSCCLGEIVAFVSHSWRDGAGDKWKVLSKWCETFERRKGRPALLWIDKCCIDQEDIEANLYCLPVFLAGCKHLMILCGETYLSRLWCVFELFVFFSMGGAFDKVVLMPVMNSMQESERKNG